MICKDLVEYTARLLSSSPLYLEVRGVDQIDSMSVKDIIKNKYTLLKRINVEISDTLEVILPETLEVTFQDNSFFYVVFSNEDFKLEVIPEWFTEIMLATKSQSIIISSTNIKGNKISFSLPDQEIKINKFNILIED